MTVPAPATRETRPEEVVLLDRSGRAIGTAPKADVHGEDTPLHLAFSAYLFDASGRLLVTRRAASKRTFPGVWTNTVCGHPGPGEPLGVAVVRRAADELGVVATGVRLALPEFRYRAEMSGVVENELCPVYVGRVAGVGDLAPDPAEVDGHEWVPWPRFAADVVERRRTVSPWCLAQVAALVRLGPDPDAWPVADPALLPPACPPERARHTA
ncbi:MAG TPA: isopentenyl-diphosphate Delta-isomerase [Intrasporangium sp.]|uniref:isopentenyl-diphosphate Delta-isomerase n=1 Tax=Intrasporangium sp. TaxID=1925024 RepID=UPI002D79209F|nr:isopentenyl-diphosphate Delta-isomerase [Intrasporangium sp.]HET7397838.1 isopentenyl-diphosphate Delta-isomerase [Intrasporangium sp.]